MKIVTGSGMMKAGIASLILSVALAPAHAWAGAPQTTPAKVDTDAGLTPAEKAERDGRKACKVSICAAFRARTPGPDIACNVTKSWRKTQLEKIVSKVKVSWPYGPVRCTLDVRLNRAGLIKAMTEKSHDISLEKHVVTCKIEREKEAPTELKIAFTPTVSFKDGKAASARMNWGELEAPALIKGVVWTATGTDNTINVLKGMLVDDINEFIGPKCDEVKADWGTQ